MFYLNCISRNSETLKFTLKFNKKGHWQWRFGSSFWHLAVFDLIVSADQTNKKMNKTKQKKKKINKKTKTTQKNTKQHKKTKCKTATKQKQNKQQNKTTKQNKATWSHSALINAKKISVWCSTSQFLNISLSAFAFPLSLLPIPTHWPQLRPWLYYTTVTFHRTTWSSVTPFTSSLPRWENNLHSKKPLASASKTRKWRPTYTCCRLPAISRNMKNLLWQNKGI